MQVKIKKRKGADECHFPPKYVAIGCGSVHHVGASCKLDGSHGRAHGCLKQNGVHTSEPNDRAKPQGCKHVVPKMSFINGYQRENAE
jgi:hypothetical protein